MMRPFAPFKRLLQIVLLLLPICAAGQQKEPGAYVDPFIGTAPLTDPDFIGYTPPEGWRVWAGLVYPGASLPNAMVQVSPVTEYGTGAGYQYEDTRILGFTHTNKGHWNLCNIPVLPVAGAGNYPFGSRFSHKREEASAGYYQVYLDDYDVNVRLTSTLRCAVHEYTFPEGADPRILFDLAKANNRVSGWDISKAGSNAVRGFQKVGSEKIFFFARLSHGVRSLDVTRESERDGYAIMTLEDEGRAPVVMKIGLSYVSTENARENLEKEVGEASFDDIRGRAGRTWNDLLSHISVRGGTERQKELFYTSVYRSFLWPALRSDVNGEFTDVKGQVRKEDFNYYTIPSLWDTYRNKLVLLTLISPDVTADVIRSLTDRGDLTGFIPTFFHGDHAAPFIAGALARGIRDFDAEKAFELLLNNAYKEGGTRPHINEYMAKGYISDPDVESPHVETKGRAGVSKTLEYAYDDYSLAQLAKALGKTENYEELMKRSQNYRNVFDPSTRFMRGRLENGEWIRPFNPQYPYYEYMYREANAWQVSFYVPHDMPGLVELYGGKKKFEKKLDSLFTLPWNPQYIARNVSSFIGQYCHGNQPGHEAPFAYYFAGKPWKSQHVIDTLLENYYGVGEEGLSLPGMDDAGEMSSWYVFAAMGFYPLSPADPEYLVTVPLFDQVRIQTGNGGSLTLRKKGNSRKITGITVNGARQEGYFISHDLFRAEATVDVQTE